VAQAVLADSWSLEVNDDLPACHSIDAIQQKAKPKQPKADNERLANPLPAKPRIQTKTERVLWFALQIASTIPADSRT
jgi:hypothetical protein